MLKMPRPSPQLPAMIQNQQLLERASLSSAREYPSACPPSSIPLPFDIMVCLIPTKFSRHKQSENSDPSFSRPRLEAPVSLCLTNFKYQSSATTQQTTPKE